MSACRALVVEDEPLARRRLREFIDGVPWLQTLGEAGAGRQAVAMIDALAPDLVFLDIQLPGISGLEVLRRIRSRPAVIFTTAFDRFAVTAFELGAIDYLLKPFGEERFNRAIERARPLFGAEGMPAAARARETLAAGPLQRLFVRDRGRIVPIQTAAIERLEADDDSVQIHTSGRVFHLNLPLAELAARLDPGTFVRVHRSHVVNLDLVQAWTPHDGSRIEITLKSGTRIVASRQMSRVLRTLGR